ADAGGPPLGAGRRERLRLLPAAGLEPGPRLLDEIDAGEPDRRMAGEDLLAQRDAERLDRRRGVILLADDAVDQVLERLAGDHRLYFVYGAGGHREVLRIVPVAAPDHAQHPQPRLAVAARLHGHFGTTGGSFFFVSCWLNAASSPSINWSSRRNCASSCADRSLKTAYDWSVGR